MTTTPEQLREAADALRAESWDTNMISDRLIQAIRPLDYQRKVSMEILRDSGNEMLYHAFALALELEAVKRERYQGWDHHGDWKTELPMPEAQDMAIVGAVRRYWSTSDDR